LVSSQLGTKPTRRGTLKVDLNQLTPRSCCVSTNGTECYWMDG